MEQEIFQKIEDLYQQTKSLLLDPESYERPPDVETVSLLLGFIERALHRPVNRLVHLEGFLRDPDGLLVQKMWPFAGLHPGIRERIRQHYNTGIRLTECYAILYPEREAEIHREPHGPDRSLHRQ